MLLTRPVVEERAVAPVAALVTDAAIAEAVVDAAVKADFRAPISFVETRRRRRRSTPSSRASTTGRVLAAGPRCRHPIIAVNVCVPRPIAGRPQIARAGDDRLVIDRQWRGFDIDADANAHLSVRSRDRRAQRGPEKDGQGQCTDDVHGKNSGVGHPPSPQHHTPDMKPS